MEGDSCVPTSTHIIKVLNDMRIAISNGKFIPVSRRKNMMTLASLGITWKDAKEEIYDLAVSDYIDGPIVDRDYPSTDRLWIFKKSVLGQIIYIKFKVLYQEDGSVKIISFHIDEV